MMYFAWPSWYFYDIGISEYDHRENATHHKNIANVGMYINLPHISLKYNKHDHNKSVDYTDLWFALMFLLSVQLIGV